MSGLDHVQDMTFTIDLVYLYPFIHYSQPISVIFIINYSEGRTTFFSPVAARTASNPLLDLASPSDQQPNFNFIMITLFIIFSYFIILFNQLLSKLS